MEETIPDRFSALNQQLFYYQATAEGDIKSIKEIAGITKHALELIR